MCLSYGIVYKGLQRHIAQRDQRLRAHHRDLAHEPRGEKRLFLTAGRSVDHAARGAYARGPDLDDVGDINLAPAQAQRLQKAGQIPPGLAHEGPALQRLLFAGRLPYQHEHRSVRRTIAKDQRLLRPSLQRLKKGRAFPAKPVHGIHGLSSFKRSG